MKRNELKAQLIKVKVRLIDTRDRVKLVLTITILPIQIRT